MGRLSFVASLLANVRSLVFGRGGSSRLRRACATLVLAGFATVANGREFMPPAPAGQTETGVPSFVVFGTEAIGLQRAPTGMHLLPDGRVLLSSAGELAFTDGLRWEVFRAAEGEPLLPREGLVDSQGAIYFGVQGALGRVEFLPDGTWRTTPVARLPDAMQGATMSAAVAVGADWYWLGGGGPFVKWHPGETPQLIPNGTTIERLFAVNGELFASEQTSGGLFCMSRGGARVTAKPRVTSALVTAAVPFAPGEALVATGRDGLELFDGKRFAKFGVGTIGGSGLRTSDLCAIGDEYFAAAVDTRGILFFDRGGRIVQSLDATLDHRLARVHQLRYSADGVLWALLEDGVARIQFPSRVSRFEAIIPAGLSYVAPVRHHGRLWLLAEGRALRGDYDDANRLQQFVPDSPPGSFVFTLSVAADTLFACTDTGIFAREGDRWVTVATGIVNARVGMAQTPSGGLLYAARAEIGELEKISSGWVARRSAADALGDSYAAAVDRSGIVWLELGARGVGRIDPAHRPLSVSIYGREAGVPDGWAGLFPFEGEIHVVTPHHLSRFDEAQERFVPDDALVRRFPQFLLTTMRPEVAPDGRVWYAQDGFTWIVDPRHPEARPEKAEVPFAPLEYSFETGGVVWLRGERSFVRYDPHAPAAKSGTSHVTVTSAEFPNSSRRVFGPTDLGVIPYADNTVAFRFAAPGNPFDSTTSFQVQLEGVSDRWTPVGNTGQAIFNRLKEGHYVFRVRALTASGAVAEAAPVRFRISPPWFRSGVAWASYLGLGVGLLLFSAWYPAQRQRREKARLAVLVANRTEELNQTNQQLERQIEETTEKSDALAASEERYRTLNAELEQRVAERTAELSVSNQGLRDAQEKLAATYRELLNTSRMAGMAEVATSVLHNVGNVLNSLNVSANLIGSTIRGSRPESLRKIVLLLQEHAADLGAFLTDDPKGKLVPKLLDQLAEKGITDRDWLMQEIVSLQKNIDHIKEIVAMQQSYATVLGVTETLDAAALFDDAIRMNAGALTRHDVKLVREFEPVPQVCVEKGKVLQILVNLIRNAKYACDEGQALDPHEKIIVARLESSEGKVRFIVRDNGVGILPENLTKIFSLGFTTRAHGHGFGLHSSILAAREMKGTLTAASDGRGTGATFTLEIPVAVPAQPSGTPTL